MSRPNRYRLRRDLVVAGRNDLVVMERWRHRPRRRPQYHPVVAYLPPRPRPPRPATIENIVTTLPPRVLGIAIGALAQCYRRRITVTVTRITFRRRF